MHGGKSNSSLVPGSRLIRHSHFCIGKCILYSRDTTSDHLINSLTTSPKLPCRKAHPLGFMASCLDPVPSTYFDMRLLLTHTPRQLEGSHWGSAEQTSTSVPLQAGSAGNQQPAEYKISLGGIWHDRDWAQEQRKLELQCSSAALRGHDKKKSVTGNKHLYSKGKPPVPQMMSLNQYKDWEDKSETACLWSTAWIVTQTSKAWSRVPATAQQPLNKKVLCAHYGHTLDWRKAWCIGTLFPENSSVQCEEVRKYIHYTSATPKGQMVAQPHIQRHMKKEGLDPTHLRITLPQKPVD